MTDMHHESIDLEEAKRALEELKREVRDMPVQRDPWKNPYRRWR